MRLFTQHILYLSTIQGFNLWFSYPFLSCIHTVFQVNIYILINRFKLPVESSFNSLMCAANGFSIATSIKLHKNTFRHVYYHSPNMRYPVLNI